MFLTIKEDVLEVTLISRILWSFDVKMCEAVKEGEIRVIRCLE